MKRCHPLASALSSEKRLPWRFFLCRIERLISPVSLSVARGTHPGLHWLGYRARLNPDRLTSCTEYGQFGGGKRWYGPRGKPEDPVELQQDVARIVMEQTEAMRRARFDIIMPYGWHSRQAEVVSTPV